ncbi:hypothetical protein [Rhodovulum sulfidophilum]|uniref:hypothetical protein n=1 Tax=Rhodovulum sulfidophilum TaxID=35806 RepID=UPI000950C4CA|nr:hypothetical protein [Rhodovulum sulfidophilum]MBL3553737.1 hypothetical protein [Rhodovulum sulfidophilum]OLS47915.1 hypothetical protein BV379_06230 [Rhodovulum sulfidophilum]
MDRDVWIQQMSSKGVRPLVVANLSCNASLSPGISLDGKARGLDSIFIERLWRPLIYVCNYLHACA